MIAERSAKRFVALADRYAGITFHLDKKKWGWNDPAPFLYSFVQTINAKTQTNHAQMAAKTAFTISKCLRQLPSDELR